MKAKMLGNCIPRVQQKPRGVVGSITFVNLQQGRKPKCMHSKRSCAGMSTKLDDESQVPARHHAEAVQVLPGHLELLKM